MMAGAILTQTERELAAMNDASPMALKAARGRLKEAQALNADLRVAVSALTKENGDLTREREDRNIEIADWRGRLSDALDLLDQAQARTDATQAELNKVLAVVSAARTLLEKWEDRGERSKVTNLDFAQGNWVCLDDLRDVLYPREASK